jgi:hypothetical protein
MIKYLVKKDKVILKELKSLKEDHKIKMKKIMGQKKSLTDDLFKQISKIYNFMLIIL